MSELGFPQEEPTLLFQDNVNVLFISESIGNESRTRYLINKINFIRECVNNNIIQLRYIPTKKNVADIFTKALCREQFHYLLKKIMNGVNFETDKDREMDLINEEEQ